jgi:hypothetical protein
MKAKLISLIAGPLGIVVRPILAAIVGALVALAYKQAWILLYKVAWLASFTKLVIDGIPAETLAMLTPKAIGGAVAVALWLAASDWIIASLKGGVKQIQTAYNAAPNTGSVKPDGLAIRGGETATAISRLAYEAEFPGDLSTRPSPGVPEIRRPLP